MSLRLPCDCLLVDTGRHLLDGVALNETRQHWEARQMEICTIELDDKQGTEPDRGLQARRLMCSHSLVSWVVWGHRWDELQDGIAACHGQGPGW